MRPTPVLLLVAFLLTFPAAGQTSKRRARTHRAAPSAPAKVIGSTARRPAEPSTSRFAGEPISLDLKDADLRDVLHTFSRLTGLNLVVDPDVKGSVTIRLHDVPWDQALDLIVRTNGFGYVLEGNVLRVGTVAKLSATDPIE
jgi:type II secretory pathway component HofQ